MQANYYYKCEICGCICNLKYQLGFSKHHPIRYRCSCGITIKGQYQENQGITFENAIEVSESLPNFVVHSSGEFLTRTSYNVSNIKDTLAPTSFICATQKMDYEKFRKVFTAVINYRDNRTSTVRAINELYEAQNLKMLEKVIREKYDPNRKLFPLNNEADYLRAVTMINQFQFLNYNNTTEKTTDLFLSTFHANVEECTKYFVFLSNLNKLNEWKRKIYHLSDQIYSKIDLLIPAIGIDFYYDKTPVYNGELSITTSSFEDIKQLYVDLYELIANLIILPMGFDNILLRNSYESIKIKKEINVQSLSDVSKMRNKGNIIALIDSTAPFECLLCDCLDTHIRNGIGHFSYKSEEIASRQGQTIRFYSINSSEEYIDLSLVEICYNIWNMYKCLGVFNELIHHIELQILSKTKGISPSFITDKKVRNNMHGLNNAKKIYPNDLCPCGSGLKYKKCCKNKY